MGNQHKKSQADKEAEEFVDFLENRNKSRGKSRGKSSGKSALSTQKTWRQLILDTIQDTKKSPKYKPTYENILSTAQRIRVDSFVKAVSVLCELRNEELNELRSTRVMKSLESDEVPDVKKSKNVFVSFTGPLLKFSMHLAKTAETLNAAINPLGFKFDKPKRQTYEKSPEASGLQQASSQYKQKKKVQQKRNRALVIHTLSEQFNQSYHPYNFIKQTFSKSLQIKYKDWMHNATIALERLEIEMRSDLLYFCTFLADCSDIYRNWIVNFTKIRADKVDGFMRKAVMNSVFNGEYNMHRLIMVAINKVNRERALQIAERIKDNVSIEKFSISPKLQIHGSYFQSLMLLSTIDRITNPRELLKFMERMKDEICNDIDQFHKFYETDENCTIDGDNLIGILCFLVCRMKAKLPQIYAQISFLRVTYGDEVTLSFQSASYMVTAFLATLQYIQSQDFCKATS